MTVLARPATAPAGRRFRLAGRGSWSRLTAWHPEWWVYAVAGLAWLDLVLMAAAGMDAGTGAGVAPAGHSAHGGMDMSAGVTGSASFVSSWSAALSHWTLMLAAMMLPVVAPLVGTVALRSLWSRRQRSAAYFLLGYAVVWVAVGVVLLVPLVALDAYPLGTPWLVGLLVVAAGWQVAPPRRRALRRCGSLRLGAADGRPADRNCARLGVRAGVRCLVTCGPLMLTMLASHSVLLMAGLLAVMLSERSRGPDPVRRAGRPLEAWVILAFAAVATAFALQ